MRSACFVLLISAVLISAEVEMGVNPKLRPAVYSEEASQSDVVAQKLGDSEEFQNVVDYLNENASGNDLYEIIDSFNDVLDDLTPEDRSISSLAHEVFNEIPWAKVNQYIQGKLAGHPKFAKLYEMVNDPKFQDLLNKAVNSQALRNYAKSVQANGFTWSAFVTFAFKAICDTAIVSHHDVYSEGVCQALKNL